MKIKFFLLILPFFFTIQLTTDLQSATDFHELDQGPEAEFGWVEYLFSQGETAYTINAGLRFIYLYPTHKLADNARMLIGKSYLKDKGYGEAIEIFKGLSGGASRQSMREEAEFWLCKSLLKQGEYSKARRRCADFRTRYPHSEFKEPIQYQIGWSFLKEWMWEDAEEAFGDIDPGSRFYEPAQEIIKETKRLGMKKGKSPFTAGILSALLPGSGYIYTGKWQTGIMAFLVNGTFIAGSIECFNHDLPVLGCIIGLVEMGWYSGTIYGSVNGARQYNYRIKEDFLLSLSQRFELPLLGIGF
ncbi:tetratricopeptide repeat protein [bacterium]|nr:tetratricopeptide repeat protein [bacterium]